jgi:hypothetical protein
MSPYSQVDPEKVRRALARVPFDRGGMSCKRCRNRGYVYTPVTNDDRCQLIYQKCTQCQTQPKHS